MIRLYQFAASGNCHKVRLMLSLLQLPFVTVDVVGANREHKTAEFLAKNPLGQVPVLTDNEVTIHDSQAILVYLARRYGGGRWLPDDAASLAHVCFWLSFAANEVAHGPNMLRLHHKWNRAIDVDAATATTTQVLTVLEQHLGTSSWLVGAEETAADVAVYPYIALAPEGRVELADFPHVLRWLAAVRELPGYIDMPGMIEG